MYLMQRFMHRAAQDSREICKTLGPKDTNVPTPHHQVTLFCQFCGTLQDTPLGPSHTQIVAGNGTYGFGPLV